MQEGYIKIFRSILEWEWYDDINVKVMFLHLLLKANYSDKKRRGILIKRGEFLTSIGNLSVETGLSKMKVRWCINKLKLTGEITTETTNSYTIVKLNNYNKYNSINTPTNKRVTDEQQTNNKRVTTTKNNKNIKKEKNNKKYIESELAKNFEDLKNKYFNSEFIKSLKIEFDISTDYLKNEISAFSIHWMKKDKNGTELWCKYDFFDIESEIKSWLYRDKKRNRKNTRVDVVETDSNKFEEIINNSGLTERQIEKVKDSLSKARMSKKQVTENGLIYFIERVKTGEL